MDLSYVRQLAQTPDLAHRLRRLSFFDGHFRRHLDSLAARSGLAITVDPVRLTRAFLAWGEDFMRQRAAASLDRRDYIVFTAGMLLIRLLEAEPVTVTHRAAATAPAAGEVQEIIAFWPEGFLYTEYCLNVLQAVLRQEFAGALPDAVQVTALADDLRVWWSLRENVAEDPGSAIGFFDLFVGSEPNWQFPLVAMQRPAMQRAAHPVTALQ